MQTSTVLTEEKQDQVTSSELMSGLGVSPITADILIKRGVKTVREAQLFLYGTMDDLFDPFELKGMRQAVSRIMSAIEKKEKILIHGDYDVDGITSTAFLARIFERLGVEFITFLPHRVEHGYGFSAEAVDVAAGAGVKLIITVDCGSNATEEVLAAAAKGIDVIVTDHHQVSETAVPSAVALINPWQADCVYPFRDLSGVGVVYKLAQALIGKGADEYLDLVAFGTVSDLSSLVSENRIIVKYGLQKFAESTNSGIRALARVANFTGKKINTGHLGFIFGPRINASGRMGSADCALRLLVTDNEREADSLAKVLNEENKQRQKLERKIVKEAIAKVEREVNFNRDRVIVVWDEGWHPGVIGIVASRLIDRFYRPAIVINVDGAEGRGSGRSIKNFNLHKAVEKCGGNLLGFGGHEMAIGLTIKKSNLESFRREINEVAGEMLDPEDLVKKYSYDAEVALKDIDLKVVREISALEPFGRGNPKPVFLVRGLRLRGEPRRRANNTLKMWVTDGNITLEAIWFKFNGDEEDLNGTFDLIAAPTLKVWQGRETISLEIKAVQ